MRRLSPGWKGTVAQGLTLLRRTFHQTAGVNTVHGAISGVPERTKIALVDDASSYLPDCYAYAMLLLRECPRIQRVIMAVGHRMLM